MLRQRPMPAAPSPGPPGATALATGSSGDARTSAQATASSYAERFPRVSGACPYRRLVLKRPVGRAFQILVLAGLERPKECGEPNAAHKEGQRNEPCKCGHCANSSFAVRKRSAFTVTMMDDVDIAMAAINGVTIPAMASGMKSIL